MWRVALRAVLPAPLYPPPLVMAAGAASTATTARSGPRRVLVGALVSLVLAYTCRYGCFCVEMRAATPLSGLSRREHEWQRRHSG